ncbi:MAG: glycosyltransferase [Acidimicrobiales bacterium]
MNGPRAVVAISPATSLLRRFAAIGAVVTAIDIGLLLILARGAGWPLLGADLVALVAAASVSFLGNRAITFADDPSARWVRFPAVFGLIAAAGAALDLSVLGLLDAVFALELPVELLGAKAVAVAAAALFRLAVYRTVLFEQVQADLAVRTERPPASGSVRLSVVVPAFNDVGHIPGTIARLRRDLAALGGSGPDRGLEIVVVDDGSHDGTAGAARQAGADQVIVQPANRGKGAAVRVGMLEARGRTIAFTDADLAYPPAQLVGLVTEVEDGWDVVVGSRRHTDTNTLVRARRLREVGGRVINRLTHAVLLGHHRDTQCGLKAFRSDVARLIFSKSRLDGFACDVEVFHLAERYRLSLREVPVEVENSTSSTVHVVRDGGRLVRDVLRVLRGGRQGWYDLTAAEAAVLAGAPDRHG